MWAFVVFILRQLALVFVIEAVANVGLPGARLVAQAAGLLAIVKFLHGVLLALLLLALLRLVSARAGGFDAGQPSRALCRLGRSVECWYAHDVDGVLAGARIDAWDVGRGGAWRLGRVGARGGANCREGEHEDRGELAGAGHVAKLYDVVLLSRAPWRTREWTLQGDKLPCSPHAQK